ncbi:hypothetical protein O181_004240 [Austropuccinia psidii MF-1]|uniref:Uncharacterized protein n=1 Tax=Austropuccinia psidii MF-1 TaxID=1389203 RepID=A0A9Q3BG03_9BASI|nr:hypothetical protein [Austropuccinia psidii MF-1]
MDRGTQTVSHPHRPQTVGHAKGQKDPKRPRNTKGAKMAPHHHSIKNGHSNGKEPKYSRGSKMAKKSIFRPDFKGNGDKTPPWMMPKVYEVEEGPRGPTGKLIMGIYVLITIINHFLSRRALRPSFWDATQGPFIKENY